MGRRGCELWWIRPVTSFQGYTVKDVLGIHFSDDTVPQAIRAAGEAVYQIHGGTSRGSAVAISNQGDFLTAYHVLFDKNGKLKRFAYVEIDSFRHAIGEPNIVKSDPSLDLVQFRIHGSKKISFLAPNGGAATASRRCWG